MRCPSCKSMNNKVTDSRHVADFEYIRRRRECTKCGHRWSTAEVVLKKRKKRVGALIDRVARQDASLRSAKRLLKAALRRLEGG